MLIDEHNYLFNDPIMEMGKLVSKGVQGEVTRLRSGWYYASGKQAADTPTLTFRPAVTNFQRELSTSLLLTRAPWLCISCPRESVIMRNILALSRLSGTTTAVESFSSMTTWQAFGFPPSREDRLCGFHLLGTSRSRR